MAVANAIAKIPQSVTPSCLCVLTICGTAVDPNKLHMAVSVSASMLSYSESCTITLFEFSSWTVEVRIQ